MPIACPRGVLGASDRILVATDFSPDGRKALACARDLAQRFGVETVVVHVEGDGASGARGPAVPLPAPLGTCLATLRDRGLSARAVVRRGDPATEILDVARRERVSLIVIGAHGDASPPGLLLGSVADRVMRRATTPLLVVRSEDSGCGGEQPGRERGDDGEGEEAQPGA
jgi:nucleotide-binding universal stress UspA family protein